MSDSENYETTFNHFLLHFLRYLCNFCPNTCSRQAILMKVSHLGVDTLVQFGCVPYVSKVKENKTLLSFDVSTTWRNM
jgi:hypothetical protein